MRVVWVFNEVMYWGKDGLDTFVDLDTMPRVEDGTYWETHYSRMGEIVGNIQTLHILGEIE